MPRLLRVPEVIHSPTGLVSLYSVTVCLTAASPSSASLGRYLLGPSGAAEGTEDLKDIAQMQKVGASCLLVSFTAKEIF